MQLIERHYYAERGSPPYQHQVLEVVQEEVTETCDRQYIRFTLMEARWRSKQEAADYLRWAAKEIEGLPGE